MGGAMEIDAEGDRGGGPKMGWRTSGLQSHQRPGLGRLLPVE